MACNAFICLFSPTVWTPNQALSHLPSAIWTYQHVRTDHKKYRLRRKCYGWRCQKHWGRPTDVQVMFSLFSLLVTSIYFMDYSILNRDNMGESIKLEGEGSYIYPFNFKLPLLQTFKCLVCLLAIVCISDKHIKLCIVSFLLITETFIAVNCH